MAQELAVLLQTSMTMHCSWVSPELGSFMSYNHLTAGLPHMAPRHLLAHHRSL